MFVNYECNFIFKALSFLKFGVKFVFITPLAAKNKTPSLPKWPIFAVKRDERVICLRPLIALKYCYIRNSVLCERAALHRCKEIAEREVNKCYFIREFVSNEQGRQSFSIFSSSVIFLFVKISENLTCYECEC